MSESPSHTLDVRIAMQTDRGQKRQQNQDTIGRSVPEDPAVLARWGRVFVLADGVGGLPGGDLASQYAVSTVLRAYFDAEYDEPDPAKRLARAIAEANTVIYEEGQAQTPPTTMATTIVAAVIQGSTLIIGSVGDSPAYLLRDGEARQLTLDHNLESLQRAAGVDVTPDSPEGRKLVRALGNAASVKVDIITGRVREGDTVVLCSDGLTRYVTPEEIESTVAQLDLDDAVAELIDIANGRGGADNISVIMLHINEDEAHLLNVPDPMDSWGQPRRAGRRGSERPRTPKAAPPSAAKPPASRDEPGLRALLGTVVQQAFDFMRSNTVITGVGLAALLVVFVIVMVIIAGVGDGSGDGNSGGAPRPTHTPPSVAQTETMVAGLPLTQEAALAATEAQIARMTLTPPTSTYTPSPAPTGGPMLDDQTWFRVLDGDPIITHTDTALGAPESTPLLADDTYRVVRVVHGEDDGPWYQVIDHLGATTRWVNGPSLHQRIIAVDDFGIPLPTQLQPLDVPPDGTPYTLPATSAPSGLATDTPSPTGSGTPASDATLAANVTPSPTPNIAYGVENWDVGDRVVLKADLDLCRVPDVTQCEVGAAAAGESGIITDGPRGSGEHWWWEVELGDGRSGWVAQVLLGLE